MIGHLRGQVTHRDAGSVIIDVRGVGYVVEVADAAGIPAPGEAVELHISTQVRDDAIDLYGFGDRAGLALFEQLVGVSGVGPKLAMASLRTHRPGVLRQALAAADLETLKAVPGIGDKSAQRLVLELQGEVELEAVAAPTGDGSAEPDVLGEVREALRSLGYSAGEAQAAVAEIEPDGAGEGQEDTAELVRRALRELGGGGQ